MSSWSKPISLADFKKRIRKERKEQRKLRPDQAHFRALMTEKEAQRKQKRRS